jgi:hypothetical protein
VILPLDQKVDALVGLDRQSGATGKNADVHAARLTVNDGICKRGAELKAAQSQKSELSRDQLREFFTEVILTPAGKVDEQSRLCQSCKVTPEFVKFLLPLWDWIAS